jgi:hypothetical protein
MKILRVLHVNLYNKLLGVKSGYEIAACNKTVYIDTPSNMLKVKQLLTSMNVLIYN